MNIRHPALATILIISLLSSGCIIYKVDIQQGNEITTEMVAMLKIGMTRQEVTHIIGQPLIKDPFHKDRWDYYYFKKNQQTGEIVQEIVSLHFSDKQLAEVISSFDQQ